MSIKEEIFEWVLVIIGAALMAYHMINGGFHG